jgi:hypothetical protein
MINIDFTPTQHYMWFNGCACQFQSSLHFYFVFWYSLIIKGCGMSWFFFGDWPWEGRKWHGENVVVKWASRNNSWMHTFIQCKMKKMLSIFFRQPKLILLYVHIWVLWIHLKNEFFGTSKWVTWIVIINGQQKPWQQHKRSITWRFTLERTQQNWPLGTCFSFVHFVLMKMMRIAYLY